MRNLCEGKITVNRKPKNKFGFCWFNFLLLIVAGVVNATGVVLLLYPSGVIDGGVSGLSMFISTQTGLQISIFLVCLNVPLFLLGLKKLGVRFIAYSLVSIAVYSVFAFLYQDVFRIGDVLYKLIAGDMLIASVFGGLLSGLGSGITIRYGGAIDGVEVLAVLYAKRIGISVGQFVMAFNLLLYIIASAITKNVLVGCYSVISYAVGLKVVDFVVDGFDKGKACTIITKRADLLANAISAEMGRGITVIDSKGYYSKAENTMLYCVVNRFEIVKLKDIISRVDPTSFVAINDISEVLGNRLKVSFKKGGIERNGQYFGDDKKDNIIIASLSGFSDGSSAGGQRDDILTPTTAQTSDNSALGEVAADDADNY